MADPIKEKIRAELVRWLWGIEPGKRWTEAEVDSDELEDFEQRVKTWACEEFVGAHQPERDQCGMPEHDSCFWCGKLMPNSWQPRAAEQPGETCYGLDSTAEHVAASVLRSRELKAKDL